MSTSQEMPRTLATSLPGAERDLEHLLLEAAMGTSLHPAILLVFHVVMTKYPAKATYGDTGFL